MTIDEMIAVLEAYKQGKKIEFCNKDANNWIQIIEPSWNFGTGKYRVKKEPTNLEVANKMMKETFGIDDYFTKGDCPPNKVGCDEHNVTICRNCTKWWNEEYKGENKNE